MPDLTTPPRRAALGALAIVGFLALVSFGIFAALYAAEYVPLAVNRLGAAAVSLSQLFTPGNGENVATTTASSTPSQTGTSTTPTPPVSTGGNNGSSLPPITHTPGKESTGTYPVGGGVRSLYGYPDLTVAIQATGYLATTSADSFIATTTVPANSRPAIRFVIKNSGTNVTGAWRFSASIPTQTAYIFESQPQQALYPGDSIEYTLGFDQATPGQNQPVSVTANFDNAVKESNTANNSASTKITILGS